MFCCRRAISAISLSLRSDPESLERGCEHSLRVGKECFFVSAWNLLPWYVYYSYVHNVVVIAHRHLFANLFLSFGKTTSWEWLISRWGLKLRLGSATRGSISMRKKSCEYVGAFFGLNICVNFVVIHARALLCQLHSWNLIRYLAVSQHSNRNMLVVVSIPHSRSKRRGSGKKEYYMAFVAVLIK